MRKAERLLVSVAVLLAALIVPASRQASAATTILVPAGSVVEATSTTARTRAPPGARSGFNDSAWAPARRELGYGDGDEATVVSFGPNASTTSTSRPTSASTFTVDRPVGSFVGAHAAPRSATTARSSTSTAPRSSAPTCRAGRSAYDTLASAASAARTRRRSYDGERTPTAAGRAAPTCSPSRSTRPRRQHRHQLRPRAHRHDGDDRHARAVPAARARRRASSCAGGPTSPPTAACATARPSARSDQIVDERSAAPPSTRSPLTGLSPDTRYYYSVGTATETLAGGDATHFFVTAPLARHADPTRIWVLGDSGTANASAARRARRLLRRSRAPRATDLWLMLGDNAYETGTDAEYQAAVFDMYPGDAAQLGALADARQPRHRGSVELRAASGPYYDIFTLPDAGAGGRRRLRHRGLLLVRLRQHPLRLPRLDDDRPLARRRRC